MVSCRVRFCEDKVKCYRCLGVDHMANSCNGEDISCCCRECGASGHQAVKCDASVDDRVAFKAILSERSPGDIASSSK